MAVRVGPVHSLFSPPFSPPLSNPLRPLFISASPRVPVETQPHPFRRIGADLAIFVDADAVDEGTLDGAAESVVFEGRPAALVEESSLVDGVRLLGVHDDEVSPVAFADEAAVLDAEEHCGRVAGAFDGSLEREGALRDQIEQYLEGMLHERQSGRGFEVGLRFLLPRVRGVVGRDDVDDAVPVIDEDADAKDNEDVDESIICV